MAPPLLLLLLLLLLLPFLLLLSVASLCIAQTVGDDSACLIGLKTSLKDRAGGGRLSQWTSAQLAIPCNGSTGPTLEGIVCNNQRVYSISLNATNLAGSIPSSLANCSYLQTLDLSSNQLYGPIPSNISNLSYLTILNFSNNHLTGSIPVELSTCSYLNVIDLHQNELTGMIPGQLGSLIRLRVFDVSNNRLFGAIPYNLGQASNGALRFNASSFQGNKDLYGFPLPPKKSHSLSVLAIVGIGLGSGLFSLIVSFTAVCIWLRATDHGYAAEEGKISQLVTES